MSKKIKYICRHCGLNLTGSEGLQVDCNKCDSTLVRMPTKVKDFEEFIYELYDYIHQLKNQTDESRLITTDTTEPNQTENIPY